MKYVCSQIVVDDVQKSTTFYCDIMGQKVAFDFGENVLFEGGFAIHDREHYSELIEKQSAGRCQSKDFELYFETDDLARVNQELKERNFEFVHEMQDQPWCQRVLRFYDPDGHIVEVGETMQAVVVRQYKKGMSIETIHAETCMPVKFIENAVANMELTTAA